MRLRDRGLCRYDNEQRRGRRDKRQDDVPFYHWASPFRVPNCLSRICKIQSTDGQHDRSRAALRQRLAEPVLIDSPEVVLHTVNERYRDLLPPLGVDGVVSRDVDLCPADAKVGCYPIDDQPSLVAEMASRLGQQRETP